MPNLDTKRYALGRAYGRFVAGAARLDYIEGVNGYRMYLDDHDSLHLSVSRLFEPRETEYFQALLKSGDVVVDIGANIGYFTLLFSRKVGATGRVHAFEPDPTNFALLQRNLALNACQNVVLHNRALWSQTSALRLYLCEDNHGDHRVYSSEESRTSIPLQAVRLDDVLGADGDRVDLIKMDVQGAEQHVLLGMMHVLQRNPDVRLMTEVWPGGLERAGGSAREYLDLLSGLGFAFFDVLESTGAVQPVTKDALLARAKTDPDGFCNLLCERPH